MVSYDVVVMYGIMDPCELDIKSGLSVHEALAVKHYVDVEESTARGPGWFSGNSKNEKK